MTVPRLVRIIAALAALALFAAACSGSQPASESTTSDPTSSEAETETADEPVETSEPEAEPEPEPDETEPAESPAPESAEFEPGSCEFTVPQDVSADCGWVTVPQHWDDATDPDTMRLHVATFSGPDTPADATPVVYLEGGPGGDVFGLIGLTLQSRFGAMLNEHPIVMFTQRGSALSEIDLECEEIVDHGLEVLERAPEDGDVDMQLAVLQECADRLVGEGADLEAYHTVASANDVNAIREALGYDEWNVLGISYGTRLGQELVRNHPDGVRALILDSIQPTDPNLGSLAALPTTFGGALDQLFVGCEANAECAAANPNLEERFRALIETANAEPFELVASDQLTGESYDAVVDGSRLLGAVFQALYSPESFAAIPEMVGQLENGNTETLAVLTGLGITNGPFISHGMYTSVMCHDFLAELTPDSAWGAGETGDPLVDGFGDTFEEEATQFCDVFQTGSADASIIEPVTSDVPTLMLAGAYDPITPPSFATAIEPGFSNGQLAVLPHAGHGVVGDECGMAIALDFFADPTSDVDRSCIEGSSEPAWTPESLEGIGFEPFDVPFLGIEGVVPEGWTIQGPGTSVRTNTNLAHQTALIQQGGPVGVDQFLGLLAAQLGGEPVPAGTFVAGDRSFDVFDINADVGDVRIYAIDDGGFTLFAGVFARMVELPELEAHVMPTVLENLKQI